MLCDFSGYFEKYHFEDKITADTFEQLWEFF